jgi:4'-phosphopantetheinyl transferase
MQTATLAEPDTAPWIAVLDATERDRAARYVFARDRIAFVAAHALARAALTRVAGGSPAAWRFTPGPHGKPAACCDEAVPVYATPVSFNLSHTHGHVGVAILPEPGRDVGFDIEPLDRRIDLAVASRYFGPTETAWLSALPEPDRPLGFLRLWTLKEAFIKATGKGLSQDLASFWFDPDLQRLHVDASLPEDPAPEDPEQWHFEQRTLNGAIAAVGWRNPAHQRCETRWHAIDPRTFNPAE